MSDTTRVIPIFPLEIVQFPGALTPLHIFEPRYRQLLKDVLATDKTFGITCRADEPGLGKGKPPVDSVGCTVEVAVVQELPDGRSNILCVGGTRYRLRGYIQGETYLQAEVEYFEDETAFDDFGWEVAQVKGLFERALVAGRKLKEERESADVELPDLPDDAQALSFIVAAYLDIKLSEKQELLELVDTGERLRRVHKILSELVVDYERRAVIKKIARSNGHGGKLPEL
jgi:Lon protease-like protein